MINVVSRLAFVITFVAIMSTALDPNDPAPQFNMPNWSQRSTHILPIMPRLVNRFWQDVETKMNEEYKDLVPLAYRERGNADNRLYEIEVGARLNADPRRYRVLVVGVYGPTDDDGRSDDIELRYVGDTTIY